MKTLFRAATFWLLVSSGLTTFGQVTHVGEFDFEDLVNFYTSWDELRSMADVGMATRQVDRGDFSLTVQWVSGDYNNPQGINYNSSSGMIRLNNYGSEFVSNLFLQNFHDGSLGTEFLNGTSALGHEFGHAIVGLDEPGTIAFFENPIRQDLFGDSGRMTYQFEPVSAPSAEDNIKYYSWYFSQSEIEQPSDQTGT